MKTTEDPSFKGGVMSPNSKRTFAEMSNAASPVAVAKQKIILDEESFEKSFLRCLVCHEKYNMTDRSPRLLPCHHAFCLSCIMVFYKKEIAYRQSLASVPSSNMTFAVSIACPTCKANFITTEDGLRQLTTDHRIVQLMDFVGNTDKHTTSYCFIHASQPLNFFCERCIQPVCRDCTVIDHKKCAADKLVFDISAATAKYTSVLEKGITEMCKEAASLKEKKQVCEDALKTVQKSDNSITKDIKELFERLHKALNDREQELLDMATSGPNKSNEASVKEKIQKLCEKEREVSELMKAIDGAKQSSRVHELFTVYSHLLNYQTELPLNTDELQQKCQTTSKFNARDESTLLTRISNVGDIQQIATRVGVSYSSVGHSNGSSSSRYTAYNAPLYSNRYTPRTYKY